MKRKLPVILALLLVFLLAGCMASNKTTKPTENAALHVLTKEEAKLLVFTDAGVVSSDVVDLEIELDEDDGTVYYDLEFDYQASEYDYRIDALSGKILYNKAEPKETVPAAVEIQPTEQTPAETKPAETKPAETKPAETKPAETKPAETKPAETKPAETKPAETKPAETKPAETKPATTAKKKIGVTKAKNAAFKHANVKASNAWDVEVDLDTEKGKLVYEVSFEAVGFEYNYDIDAYTGKVVRSEKEYSD